MPGVALNLLAVSAMRFPSDPTDYAKNPTPSLDEYKELWALWDLVSRQMIPESELLSKPIHLRNVCLFYLGHIPTFLDIHLTRATKAPPTEPAWFSQVFERGIDPDVENPELCHAHSEIPDEWPPLGDILDHADRVRSRAIRLYEGGTAASSRPVSQALWLGFEHEGKPEQRLASVLLLRL